MTSLTPREAAIDAVYRVMAAFDEDSTELLYSGATEDSVMTIAGNSFEGLEAIIKGSLSHIGKMDTTHFLTNPRVKFESDSTAKLTANVLAQHWPAGKGRDPEAKNLLAGTRYRVDLVKQGEGDEAWKVKKLDIEVVWRQGDYSIMVPSN